MYNPITTYRFQFHKAFSFDAFEKIIPYLKKLGVSTVYASPIFEAVPGSTHGYDGLHPHCINPEIGSEEQLRQLSERLKVEGIGWLQDIVPNHMAYDTRNNWLMDVLEKGRQSIYASFFDVGWNSTVYEGRIMVPFLGAELEQVIANNELQVAYVNNKLVLQYYESAYPLNPRSYATILEQGEKQLEAMQQLLAQMQAIKETEDAKAYSQGWDEWLLQLASLYKNETVKNHLDDCIKQVNSDASLIHKIVDEQHYRLCHWQETDKQINYRRFFTVNGLICLDIQDENVFEAYHQLINALSRDGVFQGLRIDHIDGLYDPTQYLERLRKMAGEESFIVVEKILAPEETLPEYWPVEGNTGYDFLAMVNNLLTNKEAEPQFTQFYQGLVKEQRTVSQQIRDKKSYILYEHMGGELENLYRLFTESDLVEMEAVNAIPPEMMKKAIGAFLIHCPVYRYYAHSMPLVEEAPLVQHICDRIRQTEPGLEPAIDLLEDVLLRKPHTADEGYRLRAVHFYKRCMQFSGPLMAKGVEDTLMYSYNRFIAHNEVGDAPEAFGYSIEVFHEKMKQRQQQSSLSLNATSTHDTKRGEDARARLNVLTDIPERWLNAVEEWFRMNKKLKQNGMPDANDEYFIYQTLIATFPINEEEEKDYPQRLRAYLEKALRETKQHSNWTTPNEAYEKATADFAVALLNKEKPFWKSFQPLLQQVHEAGIVNSLVQVVLKFTCPGTPDVYQGCELWDLSLVDPDNRRPVDYAKKAQWLDALLEDGRDDIWNILWDNRNDARIKLWLTHTLMQMRKLHTDVFSFGDYVPLTAEGKYRNHVFAFARKYRSNWYIVAVPLHSGQLMEKQNKTLQELDWEDTTIRLPGEVSGEWISALQAETGTPEKGKLKVNTLFRAVPFFIARMEGGVNERGAGILLHITSLPSPFGIGDLGPQAKAFADFLHKSRQKYWQLLPINPTEGGQGHSPYSATSSMAGNTLLISPELLVAEGLLNQEDLHPYYLPQEGKTDYSAAEQVKTALFDKAWSAFKEGKAVGLQSDFQVFCQKEQAWVNDFACYALLKKQNEGKPWYEWPEPYKLRDEKSIKDLQQLHEEELEKNKWLQFIFFRQWHALKQYCNQRNIQLIGDLPFYVSYDSADVWTHRDIFKLDEEGNRLGLAGVPPDSFSADGQLWGMPVFRWDVLKERNYGWWIERLRKNIELFDMVRLDHFRAFADYWEVPAGEETARNGEWVPGPGADFFNVVRAQLGSLPFVAEDLGDINQDVLDLRDEFKLPGMKILQFAFGDDNGTSDYLPHNYSQNFIVYTGTHDNNTTRGWYRQEASEQVRKNMVEYVGRDLGEDDIPGLLCRMAYASVANTAIIPLQDVLGLDEIARMNTPASGENNWGWRLLPGQITRTTADTLRRWTRIYNRR